MMLQDIIPSNYLELAKGNCNNESISIILKKYQMAQSIPNVTNLSNLLNDANFM